MLELAFLLAQRHSIEILFCPTFDATPDILFKVQRELASRGIALSLLDTKSHVAEEAPEHRSYSVLKFFEASDHFDIVHFHDWKGLGFFSQTAKKQGFALQDTTIVVQIHGPTRWTWECNNILPDRPGLLKLDHMEKQSVRLADYVISPSKYMLDWLLQRTFLETLEKCLVIKNVSSSIDTLQSPTTWDDAEPISINEVVFFGRHEARKGFSDFCSAISKLNKALTEKAIQVTFLGQFGFINGKPTGCILSDRARKWTFKLNVVPHLDREGALSYLAARPRALVVIASPLENSPYTVLEAMALHKFLITSSAGGAHELIRAEDHEHVLFDKRNGGLITKIANAISGKAVAPRPSESSSSVNKQWLSFHSELENKPVKHKQISVKEWPKVAIGITHYERPTKLADAVQSALWQTYPNLEVAVVDDGSTTPETLSALSIIEQQLKRANGKIIRQENLYLGAARNTAARNTNSDYLCFLDDDNILLPHMIETLVKASLRTNADIVNCVVLTMAETRRFEALREMEHFDERVRYLPLAGPLSLMPVENVVGDATSLIRRSVFERLGGYSELRDVGYEDYEFFARAMQAGAAMEICPKPLYFYETDRPSMITSTSPVQNFKRVFDALNLSVNDEEWKDTLSLMVAQRGATVEREHIEYAAQFNYTSRELNFLRWTSKPEEILPALIDYAEVTSSPAARRAFSNALQYLREPLAMPPVEATQTSKSDAKITISLPDDPKSLRTILAEKLPYIADEDCPVIDIAETFGAAFKLRDVPTAYSVFLAALKRDEAEYLLLNPEAIDQISEGHVVDGLYHYANSGQKDNRHAFKTLHALCLATLSISGYAVQPWELEAAIFNSSTAAP